MTPSVRRSVGRSVIVSFKEQEDTHASIVTFVENIFSNGEFCNKIPYDSEPCYKCDGQESEEIERICERRRTFRKRKEEDVGQEKEGGGTGGGAWRKRKDRMTEVVEDRDKTLPLQ